MVTSNLVYLIFLIKKIKTTIRGYGLIKVFIVYQQKKILSGTLEDAENLFDKNVIPIKTLLEKLAILKK